MYPIVEAYLEQLNYNQTVSKSTLESYTRDLKCFVEYLTRQEILSIEQVTYIVLVDYFASLKTSGKATTTVARNLASVRGLFHYLELKQIIANNPMLKIKAPKTEVSSPEYLTVEEVNRFLELPDQSNKGIRDRAMFELLYATGIRVSELMDLQFKDVNLSLSYISCHDQKSSRIIPLNKIACQKIKQYIQEVRSEILGNNQDMTSEFPLFLNLNGDRMTRQGFWKIVKSYGKQCNLNKTITPHTLRHSFACHLLQNGADIRSIQEMMGHKSILSTQVYTRMTDERMKDVYNKAHPRS